MARIIRNGTLYGSTEGGDIAYDNTTSGLSATDMQSAVDTINTNLTKITDTFSDVELVNALPEDPASTTLYLVTG